VIKLSWLEGIFSGKCYTLFEFMVCVSNTTHIFQPGHKDVGDSNFFYSWIPKLVHFYAKNLCYVKFNYKNENLQQKKIGGMVLVFSWKILGNLNSLRLCWKKVKKKIHRKTQTFCRLNTCPKRIEVKKYWPPPMKQMRQLFFLGKWKRN